ncbi:hypothetical protein GOP47_0016161 [Adiantum capillus-veneris]|uniref:Secreted protein n=1 Tax=Adiantum capillus-veneris TaxID=13818 RepID=A0A9D4UL63_ADICA|nr:hypothetical protein GOP47_0016161 [Adiantum capillus-veneris]
MTFLVAFAALPSGISSSTCSLLHTLAWVQPCNPFSALLQRLSTSIMDPPFSCGPQGSLSNYIQILTATHSRLCFTCRSQHPSNGGLPLPFQPSGPSLALRGPSVACSPLILFPDTTSRLLSLQMIALDLPEALHAILNTPSAHGRAPLLAPVLQPCTPLPCL